MAAWAVLAVVAAAPAQGVFVYDYAHQGQDWVDGSCSSRQRQSPINFDDLLSPPNGVLSYVYQKVSTSLEVANNGHSFAIDFAGLGYGGINYNGAWYNLMNINVHSKSEHTFKNVHAPVELHLVHKRFDSDGLIIVAIPVAASTLPYSFFQKSVPTRNATRRASLLSKRSRTGQSMSTAAAPASAGQDVLLGPPMLTAPVQGVGFPTPVTEGVYTPPASSEPNFNPTLQMFLGAAPPQINQKSVSPISELAPLDLNTLFQGGTFFEYMGSLTAPPCAEIVTWFVRREPVMASDLQVRYLHDGIIATTAGYGNARATMPLNGRVIGIRQAVPEAPPPPHPAAPPQKEPCLTRYCRAMDWAKDTMKIARASTDYVRDIDTKLRMAAQGHVDALDPKHHSSFLPPLMRHALDRYEAAHAASPHVQEPPAQNMAKAAEAMAKGIATAADHAVDVASASVAGPAAAI